MSAAEPGARARAALRRPGAVLVAEGRLWRVYPEGDQRRRSTATLEADVAAAWVRAGVLEPAGGSRRWRLSGQADARRPAPVAGRNSASLEDPLARLSRLTANGARWVSADEIASAERLRAAARRSEASAPLVADWRGAPKSQAPRQPGLAGAERAVMARGQARAALQAVGPELAPILEAACVREHGLEAIEAAWGWPRRSAKVVLKLALARLETFYRHAAAPERDWEPIDG